MSTKTEPVQSTPTADASGWGVELTDEDLAAVVGGLERIWMYVPPVLVDASSPEL